MYQRVFLAGTMALLVFVLLTTSGCATKMFVTSMPTGARIFADGYDTGQTTPAWVSIRQFDRRVHMISVEVDGYESSPPQPLRIYTSPGKIIGSALLPIPLAIINAIKNQWKGHEPKRMDFVLERKKADSPSQPGSS